MKYSIEHITIKNFKGIKETLVTNLPKSAPWIFLTGENGYGKTSVLQGIAAGLAGFEEHLFKIFQTQSPTILINIHNQPDRYGIIGKSISLTDLEGNSKKLKELACYGSSRLQTYTESSRKDQSVTRSLYFSDTLLENIEFQFTRWHSKMEDTEFRAKYESVKELLIELLDIQDIEVTRKDEVFYIETDDEGHIYEKSHLENLAAGYKSLVGFVGDLILKLFESQPEITNPKELSGIVIIDEIDLHLHPKWQKRLPGLLSRLFPNIQFVASTHSPIPLLGAPANSVLIRINRNVEQGIVMERLIDAEKELVNLLPNSILSSPVFGLLDLFPESNYKKSKIRTEDDYIALKVSDYLSKKLKSQENSALEAELLNYITKSIHNPKLK